MEKIRCNPNDKDAKGCRSEATHDPINENMREYDMGKDELKVWPNFLIK